MAATKFKVGDRVEFRYEVDDYTAEEGEEMRAEMGCDPPAPGMHYSAGNVRAIEETSYGPAYRIEWTTGNGPDHWLISEADDEESPLSLVGSPPSPNMTVWCPHIEVDDEEPGPVS